MGNMTEEAWTHPTDGPVHDWFSLSYTNYLVLPRTFMQSMPIAWQQRAVALLDELQEAFAHVPQPEMYDVQAATEHIVGEMSDAELKQAGITEDWYRGEEPPEGLDEQDLAEWRYENEDPEGPAYHRDGDELDPHERVLLPVADPIPHYNRGRTYMQPRNPDGEKCGDMLGEQVCVLDAGWHEMARHVDAEGNWWQQARGRLSNKAVISGEVA